MPTPLCSFSLEHLSDVLVHGRRRRRFMRFGDLAPGQPGQRLCLLRHDIDISLEHAARLAALEERLGIAATYFVRLGASGYNPLSRRGRAMLRGIEQGGSEIGLHYEGAAHGERIDEAWRRFLREKNLLEDLLGRAVGIALHAPRRCRPLAEDALRSSGVLYDVSWPERFGQLTFVSDSNRRWRDACMCEHLGGEAGLHLLLHPVWWMPEVGEEDAERIIRRLQYGD